VRKKYAIMVNTYTGITSIRIIASEIKLATSTIDTSTAAPNFNVKGINDKLLYKKVITH
jgi:hypothetical protein